MIICEITSCIGSVQTLLMMMILRRVTSAIVVNSFDAPKYNSYVFGSYRYAHFVCIAHRLFLSSFSHNKNPKHVLRIAFI